MNPYYVDRLQDGLTTYFAIRSSEDLSIEPFSTRYLAYKVKSNQSPNSVKRNAFSISYYLCYLDSLNLSLKDVFDLSFKDQHIHFTDFLKWIQNGNHLDRKITKKGNPVKLPENKTCNTYLRDVMGWLQFLEIQESGLFELKVLSTGTKNYTNAKGVRFSRTVRLFKGYLPETDTVRDPAKEDELIILLNNCPNIRDKLLILFIAETGFRIGEILGIKYTSDIQYEERRVFVHFREHNLNNSRAKYAEERAMRISVDAYDLLMLYLSRYKKELVKNDHLFVTLDGNANPLTVDAVYAIFRRLKNKTGIEVTPHMIRHYFAEKRYRHGWTLDIIKEALGHKDIKTTMRYLHISNKLVEDAQDRYLQSRKKRFDLDYLLSKGGDKGD